MCAHGKSKYQCKECKTGTLETEAGEGDAADEAAFADETEEGSGKMGELMGSLVICYLSDLDLTPIVSRRCERSPLL